jgi:hypothetical protein
MSVHKLRGGAVLPVGSEFGFADLRLEKSHKPTPSAPATTRLPIGITLGINTESALSGFAWLANPYLML